MNSSCAACRAPPTSISGRTHGLAGPEPVQTRVGRQDQQDGEVERRDQGVAPPHHRPGQHPGIPTQEDLRHEPHPSAASRLRRRRGSWGAKVVVHVGVRHAEPSARDRPRVVVPDPLAPVTRTRRRSMVGHPANGRRDPTAADQFGADAPRASLVRDVAHRLSVVRQTTYGVLAPRGGRGGGHRDQQPRPPRQRPRVPHGRDGYAGRPVRGDRPRGPGHGVRGAGAGRVPAAGDPAGPGSTSCCAASSPPRSRSRSSSSCASVPSSDGAAPRSPGAGGCAMIAVTASGSLPSPARSEAPWPRRSTPTSRELD